ncbi:MAG TPA: VOC family protein [Acidobacteriaceae bacterium]|jgi:uncharacterized glyoxalase superfamily protein PhnB
MQNRSVPVDVMLSHVSYRNVAEAMAWLTRVFGFAEHYRYGVDGDQVSGAQMHLGAAYVMLRTREGPTPAELGFGTQSLTVFVDDVDAHYARSRAEGATIVEELNETMYGERQYAALDLAGHHWLFSRHARDVAPEDWGAVVAKG